jgi:hypothetical protein
MTSIGSSIGGPAPIPRKFQDTLPTFIFAVFDVARPDSETAPRPRVIGRRADAAAAFKNVLRESLSLEAM